VAKGIRSIIDVCQQRASGATIILTGITPRNDKPSAMRVIDQVNQRVAALADGKHVRYLNINEKLADSSGKLFDGMTMDGLHLAVKGYQVWADALKPILTELLGPPATTDSAPPPTGDPSARGTSLR
jgi:lysophospholipase L1-like esterase